MSDVLFSVFQDERFMDLTIYQYGYEKCEPLHSFGPYVRNNFLFHYVISGQGVLYSDDENHAVTTFQISAGQGFLIEPGFSNMYAADENDPWEYVWVEFGGLRARECMEAAGLSRLSPIYRPEKPNQGEQVKQRMFSLLNGDRSSPMERIGYLYLFVALLMKTSSTKKQVRIGKLSEFYVREAINFIEWNYARSITVEDMARQCKLDRSYFGKLFKKVVGQTPQEFLIHFRMSKAAEALMMDNCPVGEIGASVGYPNLLHFSRAFKSVYGVSPSAYRRSHKLIE